MTGAELDYHLHGVPSVLRPIVSAKYGRLKPIPYLRQLTDDYGNRWISQILSNGDGPVIFAWEVDA